MRIRTPGSTTANASTTARSWPAPRAKGSSIPTVPSRSAFVPMRPRISASKFSTATTSVEMRAADIAYAIAERTGGKKCYITFDIDCLDPACARHRNTGCRRPVVGENPVGVAAIDQSRHFGADVVEVAPAYDHADITAIAASSVAMHYIGLLAERKAREAG